MSKALRNSIKSCKKLLYRSLGFISNRSVCLKGSLPPTDQQNFPLNNLDITTLQKNPIIAPGCSIIDQLKDIKACKDILTYLFKLESKQLNLPIIICAIENLVKVQYDYLYNKHEWMQKNYHIAYIQMLLNNSLKSSMDCFYNHPCYPIIYESLYKNYDKIDKSSLTSLYLNLCYLGLSLSDSFMVKLLIEIQKKIDFIPSKQLVSFSKIFKSLPVSNNILFIKTLTRLKCIILSPKPSTESLVDICSILINIHKFISSNFAYISTQWVLSELKLNSKFESLDQIGTILRYVQSYYLSAPNCKLLLFEIVNEVLPNLKKLSNTVEPHHVAEICRVLKSIKYPCEIFNKEIEKRGEKLLKESDLRLNEIVNLMHCLSSSSDESLVNDCQRLLYSKLMQPNVKVDVVFLSNLTDCLLDLNQVNEDLLSLSQHLVAQQAGTILEYISRFNKFRRFLDYYPFQNLQDQHIFTSAVVDKLEGLYGVSLLSSSFLSQYLLFLPSYHSFPHHLYLKFLNSLPRYSSFDLCRLMKRLSSKETTANHYQKQRYLQVLGVIQQILLSRVSTIKGLDDVLPLSVHHYFPTLSSRHSLLSQRVEDVLLTLSHVQNLEQANILMQIMSVNQFFLPSVYDCLFEYLARDSPPYFNIKPLIFSASNIGYTLTNFDPLLPFITDAYFSEIHNRNYSAALHYLWCLAVMQCFPPSLFHHLFSFETLQNIDTYIEDSKSKRVMVEAFLLRLNRSVVLEQPQLSIPWFHSSTNPTEKKKRLREEQMIDEVAQVLVQVLGGEQMARHSVTTPYHYFIDFEVLLDGNSKVIDPNTPNMPTTLERVAILPYQNYSYCKNSNVLKGPLQTKHRHLKILNYKVVTVPYTDWYSMSLSENSAKIKYLKNKIFGKTG